MNERNEAEAYEKTSQEMDKEGISDKDALYRWLKIPRKIYFELATQKSTKCLVPDCEYYKEKGLALCLGHWDSYQLWRKEQLNANQNSREAEKK